MSSFHAHVIARLAGLLDAPRPGVAQEWAPSAVSVRVLDRAPTYLTARLKGSAPLAVGDADAILKARRLGPGALLDGEETRQGFADLVYGRTLALVSVAGLRPHSDEARDAGAIPYTLSRKAWREGRGGLTCDQVDQVLAHLKLPLVAMFRPALGPYDARLLSFLAGHRLATGTALTRNEIELILAGYRGEPMPSRPKGSKAGGAQLARHGCAAAVQRLVDQDLLEVVHADSQPLRSTLAITDAGRRLVARPVPVSDQPQPTEVSP